MLAIVAPGQGAQTPGFLAPWLESEEFASSLAELGDASGLDLAHFGRDADADTIRDTAVAQPLLVAASIAVAQQLGAAADVLAGHSVGELAATALAGVLPAADAMRLVAIRGRAMADASAVRPTSMTAVVGGQVDDVLAAIEAAGLTPANNNGPGQIVAAGTTEQLAELAENAPRRTRLVPLSVAGAFHTVHMEPAVEALREAAATMSPADPGTRLLSNRDGVAVASGVEVLDRLVRQVANPVRWDLCMDTLRSLGVTGLLELTPAGTLTGIAKRNLKGVELFNLNTPDQLDDARLFADTHFQG
ncbi:MAG: ACP S-malonyltransferase [Propionibacterium sp.]|nr:ACP S-malonyltransferase [Propionibacterium sp.]